MEDKGSYLLKLLLMMAEDLKEYRKSNHAYGWTEYDEYIEFLQKEIRDNFYKNQLTEAKGN